MKRAVCFFFLINGLFSVSLNNPLVNIFSRREINEEKFSEVYFANVEYKQHSTLLENFVRKIKARLTKLKGYQT